MSEATERGATVREVSAVFDDDGTLQAAVDELLRQQFNYSDVSMLSTDRAVEAKLGDRLRRVGDYRDDPDAPRTAFVDSSTRHEGKAGLIGGLGYVGATIAAGAVIASGGAVAAAIAAGVAAGGAGGLAGGALASYLGKDRADALEAQLEAGGLLLWVQVGDAEREETARRVLAENGGRDVEVHELPAASLPSEHQTSYDLSFLARRAANERG